MKSPLTVYKEVAKEFGVTADKNVEDVAKLTFARSQAQEQQHIINRLLFDIAMARIRMADAKDSTTIAAHQRKSNEFEADLRQLVVTVGLSLAMVKELEDAVGKE